MCQSSIKKVLINYLIKKKEAIKFLFNEYEIERQKKRK